MATIQVGGLATGLDTNKIIDQLIALERRPIDLLNGQVTAAQSTKDAISTFSGKLSAIKSAADELKTVDKVLVRTAASSNTSILTAVAGEGAGRGTTTFNVSQLARGSVASSTVGVASAATTVASSDGTFQFQVGAGALQSVNVDSTTTLQQLADRINNLHAGVTASAINLGTASSPEFRLQIVTAETGSASTVAVVHDDTSLALQTSQAGHDAQFTVSGFSGTFSRASNTFSDVLTGITVSLRDVGASTVTVSDDGAAITGKVNTLVGAFNDLVRYLAGQSTVNVSDDKNQASIGALATDTTAKRIEGQLHHIFSGVLTGASTGFVNLSTLGLSTQRDGTILFNQGKFFQALGQDPTAVAQVLAGNGVGNGVANDLRTYIDSVTASGGAIDSRSNGIDGQVRQLQDQIDQAQRNLDQFELNLRRQFADLESVVNGLKSQGDFITAALKKA